MHGSGSEPRGSTKSGKVPFERPAPTPRARALRLIKAGLMSLAFCGDREDYRFVKHVFTRLPELRNS